MADALGPHFAGSVTTHVDVGEGEAEGKERQPREKEQREPRPARLKVKLADGKERAIQSMVATRFWSADGTPMSSAQFRQSRFGTLPEFLQAEDELRRIWSDP
jgi:type I restriction enzyme R subunit